MAGSYLRVAFTTLLLSISVEHGKAATQRTLVCEVEQDLLFADNPSDFPNGPAYFSLFPRSYVKDRSEYSFTRREIYTLDTARSFIEKYRGASFTVDTMSGALSSIPFGQAQIKIIDQSAWDVTPRILSPVSLSALDTYLYVGYFSSKLHNYYSTLTVDPQMNGTRMFRYSELGGMYFGYCH